MTRADTAKLIAIIVMAYPNFDKFKDDEHVKGVVNMWATMFSEDDPGLVGLAVKKHISTSKWPPSVAEIREIMLEIQRPDLIPPDLAWAAVEDLMATEGEHNYGDLHRQLPEMVARAVENCGGYSTLYHMRRDIYRGGRAGMDRVAFINAYTPMYEREKGRAMCGTALLNSIDKATAAIGGGEPARLAELTEKRRHREEQYSRLWRNEALVLLEDGGEQEDDT